MAKDEQKGWSEKFDPAQAKDEEKGWSEKFDPAQALAAAKSTEETERAEAKARELEIQLKVVTRELYLCKARVLEMELKELGVTI